MHPSKIFLAMEKYSVYFKFTIMFAALLGYVCTLMPAAQSGLNTVLAPICAVYNIVHTAVFVLGLTLLVLGAALYAGGNIAPGNLKGQIQGYGMGMITGGIVGVILAMIAPWILTVITSNSSIASGSCT
jgi:hypothetical protein